MRTKDKLKILANVIIALVCNVAMLLLTATFILTFVNQNIEYLKTLPDVLLVAMPVGFMVLIFKVFCINWSPIKFTPSTKSENEQNE